MVNKYVQIHVLTINYYIQFNKEMIQYNNARPVVIVVLIIATILVIIQKYILPHVQLTGNEKYSLMMIIINIITLYVIYSVEKISH